MENKMRVYNVKLPSSTAYVTVKNLWKISKVIANTGKTFTIKDLVDNNSPINEKNLFRILSYLKYLGFVNEKREKVNVEGKEENLQKWLQNEKREIADFFFFLQDNRDVEAKRIFVEVISKHDLFLSVKEELLGQHPTATLVDLKDFLRKKVPGKSPDYYTNGSKFVIDLLSDCNLIVIEGNYDKFNLVGKKRSEELEKEPKKIEVAKTIKGESDNISLGKNKYIIKIFGDDINFEFPINKVEDLEDMDPILNIIKKKFN